PRIAVELAVVALLERAAEIESQREVSFLDEAHLSAPCAAGAPQGKVVAAARALVPRGASGLRLLEVRGRRPRGARARRGPRHGRGSRFRPPVPAAPPPRPARRPRAPRPVRGRPPAMPSPSPA